MDLLGCSPLWWNDLSSSPRPSCSRLHGWFAEKFAGELYMAKQGLGLLGFWHAATWPVVTSRFGAPPTWEPAGVHPSHSLPRNVCIGSLFSCKLPPYFCPVSIFCNMGQQEWAVITISAYDKSAIELSPMGQYNMSGMTGKEWRERENGEELMYSRCHHSTMGKLIC